MVLNTQIRKWFEENIAPDKRSVIIPREFRGVKAAERPKLIETLSNGRTPHQLYQLVVLLYLERRYEEALRRCEELLREHPGYYQAYWARGIIFLLDDRTIKEFQVQALRRMRYRDRLQEANRSFERFLKAAPQSWWSLKAQEHMRRLSEQIRQVSGRSVV
jgi:tetratricopeptide (TPR) repeat protein